MTKRPGSRSTNASGHVAAVVPISSTGGSAGSPVVSTASSTSPTRIAMRCGPPRRSGLIGRRSMGRVSAGSSATIAGQITREAARRRTFAVISHPDAGKSTLTEALALHAEVIDSAGAVHGKSGRRGVTSDWMEMERKRGISITSAVVELTYGGAVIHLLATPRHPDLPEDPRPAPPPARA